MDASPNPFSRGLSPDLTAHIARLAHLELTPEENAKFTQQMNSILEYFDRLKEVDTTGVEPTRNVMGLTDVFRPDEPKPGLTQAEALQNAPKTQEGYIKAPKII